MQISNINAGAGADNVIPGTLEAQFNLRYSPEIDADRIRERVAQLLDSAGFEYEIDWHESGRPFLTESREFADRVAACIEQELGVVPERSTSGGTSDGRFIAPTGTQVVEFGPCNESIHRVNENVALDELDALAGVYRRIIESFNTDRHRSG